MKNFAMALLASVLASGCVMVDLGYTANEDVRRHAVSTPQKVDITYSVSFDQLRGLLERGHGHSRKNKQSKA